MLDRRRTVPRTAGPVAALALVLALGLTACSDDSSVGSAVQEATSELPSRGEAKAKVCQEYRRLAADVQDLEPPNVQEPQQLVQLTSELQQLSSKAQDLAGSGGAMGNLASELQSDLSAARDKVSDALTSAGANVEAAVDGAVKDVQEAWDRFQQRADARCGS